MTPHGSQRRVVHCKRAPFDVYIGRPGPWGNPFSWKPGTLARFICTQAECLAKYEAWLRAQPELVARARRELRGKVLGCWCAPGPCHGDVLARVADEDSAVDTPSSGDAVLPSGDATRRGG